MNINKLQSGGGNSSTRIKWIDYLKGFTILGVIFVHAGGCPEWWTPNHVNTIFFFIAGMFFKPRPFIDFVRKNTYSLLIPFLIFFLLSYPFRILLQFWYTRSFYDVRWSMLLDLFMVNSRGDYLEANVPLWFLLCIFWIQLIYFALSKLPRIGNIIVLACIYFLWDFINNFPTPLMLNNALCWTLYFGIGNLTGKYIVSLVENRRNSIIIIFFGIALMMIISGYIENSSHITNIFFIIWCFVMISVASLFKNAKYMDWLGFFGANSLVVLGSHFWILVPLERLARKFLSFENVYTAIAITSVCVLFMIPTIKIISRYLPLATGKKR